MMTTTKKITVGLCHKCAARRSKPLEGKLGGHEITGCKHLSPTEWAEGMASDDSEGQSNCPLLDP